MSEVDFSTRRQSVFGNRVSEKWLVFVGDCENINNYLQEKSGKTVFILLQYLNSLLRSFGQVIFANNPISGLLILLAIGISDYKAMLTAILLSSLGFLFAKLLQQDYLGNLNGFFSYNSVLHAVVSVSLLPQLYDSISIAEPKFWLFLIMTTFISVYVTSALANLLRYLGQHPVPCLTLPFNVLQFMLIFCLLNNSMPSKILSNHLIEAPVAKTPKYDDFPIFELGIPGKNETQPLNVHETFQLDEAFEKNRRKRKSYGRRNATKESIDRKGRNRIWVRSVTDATFNNSLSEEESLPSNKTHLNWGKIFSGTIVSLSQVYGLNNIPGSVLMYLALVIYSPTTALFSYLGSLLGTLIGVHFASDPEEIYNGIWGYNGLLCAAGLGGYGFVLTVHSMILALTSVVFSTVLQHFMTPLFLYLNAPILLLPFNLTTIFFLFVTSDSSTSLPRPPNHTFPEKHRYDFKNLYKKSMDRYMRRSHVSETLGSKYDV